MGKSSEGEGGRGGKEDAARGVERPHPEDRREEPRHPMGVVTQRTGVSSHTLRAWERRYGVVEPGRTEGGHRLYSDADVEHLRLLNLLTQHGRQIGQIADRSTDELRALLKEDREAEAAAPSPERSRPSSTGKADELLAGAYSAVEAMDSEELGAILRRGALTLSTAAFLDDLLVPLMSRIGDAWADRRLRPAHEHAASAVAMRVAGWLMDNFEPAGEPPCIVVTTPSGQQHELGALAAAVTAASEGWRVRYLGPNLPAEDVALAVSDADARALALSLVYPQDDEAVRKELRALRRSLPESFPILVGGAAADSYDAILDEIDVVRIDGFRSLRIVLRRLRDEIVGTGMSLGAD
ncbi:MAG: MerR family transcriptional regulator [Longimicrobiales bacterium]|nr:MerR family transcriptional regulator [Longimicrobiales bacterium]